MKRNQTTEATLTVSTVEFLEARRFLSGNVTATLGLGGVLTVTGDAANNNVDVNGSDNPGFIRVKNAGATSINGVAFVDFPASSVAKISMNLNGGNDTGWIHDISGTIPAAITITDTASGTALSGFPTASFNNLYYLSGLNLPTASVTVTTGSLADRAFFGFTSGLATSPDTLGSVTVTTAGGNDVTSIFGSTIGSVNISTGDGNDGSGFFNSSFGTLSHDSGKGDDFINLGNDTVSGSLSVKAGDGNDDVRAESLVAGSGVIDGGAGSGDIFENGGGNSGFSVINFEGFI